MPPRKSGSGGKKSGKKLTGKKASGAKKRKQWDDYDPTEKKRGRSAVTSDDENDGGRKKPRKGSQQSERGARGSGSMFSQWKDQKINQRKKERQFMSKTDQKKAMQRTQYLEQKRRQQNTAYGGGAEKKQKPQEDEAEGRQEDDEEDEEEEDSEEEESHKKRRSVFDQFVQTFQPSTRSFEEEEEEEEEEGDVEYEEIEVDEDGNPIEPEEDDEEEEDDHTDNDAEDPLADDDQEMDEELDEEDDREEGGATDDCDPPGATDPYRQRFLLSNLSPEEAQQMDSSPRKFVPLASQNDLPDSVLQEFIVSFRRGTQPEEHQEEKILSWIPNKVYVRGRLQEAWKDRGLAVDGTLPNAWPASSPLEASLFKQFSAYADVFFAGQTYDLTRPLRRLTAMHALNHVMKSRDTVVRNNERLKKRDNKEVTETDDVKEDGLPVEETDEEKEYRDQGFCRASVLVLMPLRSAASQFVTELLELLPSTVHDFHNKDRFFQEYGTTGDADDEEEDAEDKEENKNQNNDLKEWQRVFAEGNNDDSFQIGISISRRAIKFYSDYRQADIIIASPLGLRQQLGDEVVDIAETKTISTDFLSSIEVCVLDSASLLLMQNIEHLRLVLQALNVKPKEAPNADFSRLREWNLSFLGAYFRQTIVFAHGVEPLLQNLVNKCCKNQSGVVKYVRNYDSNVGESAASITRVVPQIKQIFQRIDLSNGRALALKPSDEVELRFEYFQKHIFAPLLDNPRRHVLIFVPSYFDYVRIRNLFHENMNEKLIRAVQCCEYTTPKQVSRARTTFFHGRCHVMLFTERFHFYHQYQMRGIHQIIWYGLPAMGEFYPEMLNSFEDNSKQEENSVGAEQSMSSIALYTRLDLLRLQRIVGEKRAQRMCQPTAKKATFLFC